jgi:hypothetical protein
VRPGFGVTDQSLAADSGAGAAARVTRGSAGGNQLKPEGGAFCLQLSLELWIQAPTLERRIAMETPLKALKENIIAVFYGNLFFFCGGMSNSNVSEGWESVQIYSCSVYSYGEIEAQVSNSASSAANPRS